MVYFDNNCGLLLILWGYIKYMNKDEGSLTIAYYLSRCNMSAVRKLGYSSFREAFNDLSLLLQEKPATIKNKRDEFDPYFDNGRAGWYQRPMSPSRRIIFEKYKDISDDELEEIVFKYIRTLKEKDKNMVILKNLQNLIRESTVHYNQEFVWQDVELTNEFKDAYERYLDDNKWQIEYNKNTAVITSPTTKQIFMPNQWFVIAAYAVGVYEELQKYKDGFCQVAEKNGKNITDYAKKLRDEADLDERNQFIDSGKIIYGFKTHDEASLDKAVSRLWRFATDYSWWSGQKTIDRGDFHFSVILNMLNLVNSSQSFVSDIVSAFGTDSQLKCLTKNLESFTTNMRGVTYDFKLVDSDDYKRSGYSGADMVAENTSYVHSSSHKISISQASLDKIGKKGGK